MPEFRINEEEERALKVLVEHAWKEDRIIREKQILLWRKLKLYWDGFQRIYYSEVAHDWRTPDTNSESLYSGYYDKQVNVLQAYLESIIAALSVTVPGIECYPDDAENALDVQTARAGRKIAELVYRHNDAILLWIKALFIYSTEGLLASYVYSKEDEKYGTYRIPRYEDKEEEILKRYCPVCSTELVDDFCTSCIEERYEPDLRTEKIINSILIGHTNKPKSRQCIEVLGGLNVKVPIYASKLEDCSYLIYAYETHWTNARSKYNHLKVHSGSNASSGDDFYERWGRVSTEYSTGDEPENNVTVRNTWIRPSLYWILDDTIRNKIAKKYPKGVKVVLVDNELAEASNETLDDCWVIAKNPLSDHLYHQPLGARLTSIQDITNDVISLILQTVEHGIPQTFANPDVLDFDQYGKTEVSPGTVYPARPRTGKNLNEDFYEVRTATLSPEIQPLFSRIQELGQLTSGSMPSLFGGPAAGSSRTASEYAMSRAQSLQRLQTPWKMLGVWWKETFSIVIPKYIESVIQDEKFVEKDEQGNFVNVFIRKAELQGKIGRIETEASEQLPMTNAQKKEALMELVALKDERVLEAMFSPENIPSLVQILGLPEFKIPNQVAIEKQYEEIQLLINSEPIDEMNPSIPVEADLDIHDIEADICRHWLISIPGRQCKIDNPAGYQNVLLHLRQHMQFILPPTMPAENNAPNQPKLPGGPAQPPIPMEEGVSYGPVAAEQSTIQ